jgi:FKBP-type peptidyl-prolyl cis-trans isomerase 2
MVEPGEVAVIHFVGRIAEGEDAGEVFDTTDVDVAMEEGVYHDYRDYKPLEFRVGEGKVVPGLDEAVENLAVGESATVRVEQEEAFGEHDDDLVVEVSRGEVEVDDGAAVEPGSLVRSDAGDTGWITAVDGDTVEVDFNHELAGETVEFEVEVLDAYGDEEG